MPRKFEYVIEMCPSGFGWKMKHYAKFEYVVEENCEIRTVDKFSTGTGYVSIGTHS